LGQSQTRFRGKLLKDLRTSTATDFLAFDNLILLLSSSSKIITIIIILQDDGGRVRTRVCACVHLYTDIRVSDMCVRALWLLRVCTAAAWPIPLPWLPPYTGIVIVLPATLPHRARWNPKPPGRGGGFLGARAPPSRLVNGGGARYTRVLPAAVYSDGVHSAMSAVRCPVLPSRGVAWQWKYARCTAPSVTWATVLP